MDKKDFLNDSSEKPKLSRFPITYEGVLNTLKYYELELNFDLKDREKMALKIFNQLTEENNNEKSKIQD